MPQTTETAKISRAQASHAAIVRATLPTCGHGFVLRARLDKPEVHIIPMRCHLWSCSFCSTIRRALATDKARRGHPQRHIVLTLKPMSDQPLAYRILFIRKKFRLLVQKIRRTFKSFEYMAALELQKNGTPHMHVLQRGTYIPWAWLRNAWLQLTGSWHVHIKTISRTSSAISEIVKYLAKTAAILEKKLHNQPVITTSNAWILDPPQIDPAYSEATWATTYRSFSPQSLEAAAKLIGLDLLQLRPGSTVWTLHPGPGPPDPDSAARALARAPEHIRELATLILTAVTDPRAIAVPLHWGPTERIRHDKPHQTTIVPTPQKEAPNPLPSGFAAKIRQKYPISRA